jgi:Kef-type K+ transport system membrane component KefB
LAEVKEYVGKINLIFSPIFFAPISVQLNPWALSSVSLLGVVLILAIPVACKLVGCGVPAMLVRRSKRIGAWSRDQNDL